MALNKRPKIAIIGSGNIGGILAYHATSRKLGDIVLYDNVEGRAEGKSIDISVAAREDEFDLRITGTSNYEDIADSDIVVITAGASRRYGMSRGDLVAINSENMFGIAQGIRKYAPSACVIVVSNPLDAMVTLCQRCTGFPHQRVMGMAGVLDSARFATFIAEELGVSVRDVNATVLGSHGDCMVPIVRFANVNGIPVMELLRQKYRGDEQRVQETMDALVLRTQKAGGEIIRLLKDKSAYYSPASSILTMIEAIIQNRKRLITATAYLTGQFGVSGYYVGVPCILGASGVERIVEFEMTPHEKAMFDKSVDDIQQLVAQLPEIPPEFAPKP
ncbi:MAG: malate dehydrogenase [Deltaproteobacteria bacterium]|nr:malate dehydrogenase [Deltaproteobacteria bacterium]